MSKQIVIDIEELILKSLPFKDYLESIGCTNQDKLDEFWDAIPNWRNDENKIKEIEKLFGKSFDEISKSKDDMISFMIKEIKRKNFNFEIDETTVGVMNDQVIPTLHLRPKNNLTIKPENIIFSSPAAFFISTFDSVVLGFDFFEDRLYRYYDRTKNKCSSIFQINREDIIGYSKRDGIKFKTIKTSKSLSFISKMGWLPGGLIPMLAMDSIIAVEDKIKNLRDTTGSSFLLEFIHDEEHLKLEIYCEDWYSPTFTNFLEKNWINDIDPQLPKIFSELIPDESSGCYIATMAYGSYEHEKVRALRQYRDQTLSKYLFGRLFIKLYYKFSPRLVELLKDKKTINFLIKGALNFFVSFLNTMRWADKNTRNL